MMQIVIKLVLIIAVFPAFLMGGCSSFLFIKPELGTLAQEDAVVKMDQLGEEQLTLKTEDLTIKYSAVESDGFLDLSGTVYFSKMLVNTFNRAQTFNLILSFVDAKNKVLHTVDITPMFRKDVQIPDSAKFKAREQVVPSTAGIVFNYYGVFRGDAITMGTTEVYYFPFK